jgi:hypothetical protein
LEPPPGESAAAIALPVTEAASDESDESGDVGDVGDE